MAQNRTMQQKNLINKKRAMKESRERRFDRMCQEYWDDISNSASFNREKYLYKVPHTKTPQESCKKSGYNPYKTRHEDPRTHQKYYGF